MRFTSPLDDTGGGEAIEDNSDEVAHKYSLTRIVSRFDVVALQEVKRDSAGCGG
jgi:hypothetical protein